MKDAFAKAGFNTNPTCPYCGNKSELVTGDIVYPFRADLKALKFYNCEPCDAFVGTHKSTNKPLGTLANDTLRGLRSMVHKEFDPLWKEGTLTRGGAYGWLAVALSLPKELCHIAMFDVATCHKALCFLESSKVTK
jgi:hypothetical protein